MPPDSNLDHQYYYSSGGQSPYSNGIYIRRNWGKEFEAGVATGSDVWNVWFELDTTGSVSVTMTWHNWLSVYIDGLLAGIDESGSQRQYVLLPADPFPELVIGGSNDVMVADFVDGVTTLMCGNVTHWSERKDDANIAELVGKCDS